MLGKQVLLVSLSPLLLIEALFPSVIIQVHKMIFLPHCRVQLPPAACNSGVSYHQTC